MFNFFKKRKVQVSVKEEKQINNEELVVNEEVQCEQPEILREENGDDKLRIILDACKKGYFNWSIKETTDDYTLWSGMYYRYGAGIPATLRPSTYCYVKLKSFSPISGWFKAYADSIRAVTSQNVDFWEAFPNARPSFNEKDEDDYKVAILNCTEVSVEKSYNLGEAPDVTERLNITDPDLLIELIDILEDRKKVYSDVLSDVR